MYGGGGIPKTTSKLYSLAIGKLIVSVCVFYHSSGDRSWEPGWLDMTSPVQLSKMKMIFQPPNRPPTGRETKLFSGWPHQDL